MSAGWPYRWTGTIAAVATGATPATTGGGPGDSTSVPAYEVYDRAFRGGDVGTASAIGVYIVALIFVLVFLINRVAEREAAR